MQYFLTKGGRPKNDINQNGKRSRKMLIDQSCFFTLAEIYCKDTQECTFKFILKTLQLASPLAAATPYVECCRKRTKRPAFLDVGTASLLTSQVTEEHSQFYSTCSLSFQVLHWVLQGGSFVFHIWREEVFLHMEGHSVCLSLSFPILL